MSYAIHILYHSYLKSFRSYIIRILHHSYLTPVISYIISYITPILKRSYIVARKAFQYVYICVSVCPEDLFVSSPPLMEGTQNNLFSQRP